MKRTDGVSRTLAIVGTVLVWIPLFGPFLTIDWANIGTERFNFDWLIPAELFPSVALGGALLLWAALRARSRRGIVAWGLGVAVASLVGGMILASLTGLASGETEPTGLPLILVSAAFAIYVAATALLALAGVLISRDVFSRHDQPAPPIAGT